MRDPTRIPRILARLQAVWEKHPDMRLGQLIVNAAGVDPFYIEDEKLAYMIEEFDARSASKGPKWTTSNSG
jgi:uncharacterized protein YihD (DUF1040 family)